MSKSYKSLIPSFTALKNTASVVIGTFILAFGTGIFIIPNELVTGGVSGIGIILGRSLDGLVLLGEITPEAYASVINCLLFFVGFLLLGRAFAMKTLISALVYPPALSLASRVAASELFGGFFNLNSPMYTEFAEISVILAAVFGGGLVGVGCALTFLGGGSTGGTDILAFCICKRFSHVKSSVAIFIIDAAVVLLGVFVIRNMVISLLGILSALVCAIVIDRLFIGGTRAFTAQIISEKYDRIGEMIIRKLKRTVTVVDVVGGYSGKSGKMLMLTFSMNQYADLLALISELDGGAFVTVHRAHRINGEGWEPFYD